MNYKPIFLFLVVIASVATTNVSAEYYKPYNCYFVENPPTIDGVISESEWAPFQEINLDYWITYKGGYLEGATPWDTDTKNAEISLMSDSSHLFICLTIPDDFLSPKYPMRILQIYLDDHGSNYIDRRGLVLGAEYYTGKPYPNISNVLDGIAYRIGSDGESDVQLGGTMDTIVKYSHTSEGVSGKDGAYIFEFDLPFRVATHDVYDAYSTDLDMKITYGEWSQNFEQSEYWRAFIKIDARNVIRFDKSFVSKARCDIGSTQQIRIHGTWAGNGLDASNIEVKINNNYYRTNSTGWINIEDSSNVVLRKYWNITDVLQCDNYTISFTNPSIIWDQVGFNIESGKRHDLGWNRLNWVGEYFYDRQPFQGTFSLNDTLLKIETGMYAYKVVSISDNLYGLTKFVSNDFTTILDRVNVKLSIVDNRIDVLSKPEIEWSATYEYDDSPFQGKVKIKIISGQTSTPTPVGKNSYQVESIEDNKYGLSVFTSNQVDCIFDRVKITQGGVTNTLTKTGNMEGVWFKAIYEYDSKEFTGEPTADGSMNKIWVNGIPMTWSSFDKVWKYSTKLDDNGKLTFEVTSIEDMRYKLTTFIDAAGSQSITWEKPFLETPVGIASSIAAAAIIIAGLIFFFRKRR
jgi:hypothetical protein